MPYDNDEAKKAARARLEQRMSRRSSIDAHRNSSTPQRGNASAATTAKPSTRLIILIAAAIVAVIVVVATTARCSAPSQLSGEGVGTAQAATSEGGESQSESASESEASTTDDHDELDVEAQEELVELIGEDETDKLIEAAHDDADALWIAAHPDKYDVDGIEVQMKILKLAADEPTSRAYVRSFPSEYPLSEAVNDQTIAMEKESPSDNVPNTKVPHFYQWDRRWGNTVYSSAAFGLTGCGPTSYAMVYQGVTGKTDIDPYQMGVIAEERGYMSEFNGTANAFFGDTAAEFGMSYEELDPTAENLTDALESGHIVIAHLGPGLFTTRGHFFVLAGLDGNGEVILNDPYSFERSSRTWPADTIAEEATVYYSFAALG